MKKWKTRRLPSPGLALLGPHPGARPGVGARRRAPGGRVFAHGTQPGIARRSNVGGFPAAQARNGGQEQAERHTGAGGTRSGNTQAELRVRDGRQWDLPGRNRGQEQTESEPGSQAENERWRVEHNAKTVWRRYAGLALLKYWRPDESRMTHSWEPQVQIITADEEARPVGEWKRKSQQQDDRNACDKSVNRQQEKRY